MKERIEAVQRVYWAVLIVSVVLILLGLPLGNDGETMAVLDELTAFHTAFEQNKGQIEQTLLSQAKGAGLLSLDAVQKEAGGPGVPKLAVEKDAPPIQPRAKLDISSLARIQALLQPGATLTIASAQAKPLAAALSWRLARMDKDATYTLSAIEVSDDAAQESDVKRELEVDKLRRESIAANRDLAEKTDAFKKLDELYESRRKWHATWKVLQRTNEERLEAKAAMEKSTKARDAIAADYEKLAKEALAFTGGGPQTAPEVGTTQYATANVVLRSSAEKEPIPVRVPVPLDVRAVPVPSITGADLPISRSTALWEEIQDGTGAQAIERVRDHFSWHYAYVEVGGMKLGGMTVIQLAPLALIPCLLLLIRRSRRVASSYNPFDPYAAQLPRVGVGVSPINIVLLVLLPLIGCALCTISLLQLRQVPLIPLPVALGAIALGGTAHVSLKELSELRDAVRKSHSHPPVAVSK